MSNLDLSQQPSFYSRQVAEARRFFFTPRELSARSLVVAGGFERVKQDYRIERTRLAYFALELVVGGHGTATLRGKEFALSPGVLFIYDGRHPHRIVTDSDDPLEKYFIDLLPQAGRGVLRQTKLQLDHAWPVDRPADARRLFDELLYYGTSGLSHRQTVCDALLRAIAVAARPALLPAHRQGQMAFQTYQRCCQIVESQAQQLRSLSELAEACQLDPAYLCRLFQRFDHQTPHDRLIRRRMDLAAAKIGRGDSLIKEVAMEMGFDDPFNFSRTFKSVFGVSPARFRATHARVG